MPGGVIGEATIVVSADSTGFVRGLEKQTSSVGGHGKKAGKAYGDGFGQSASKAFKGVIGTIAAIGIASFVKDSIQGASDLEESTNKIKVIFGSAAKTVESFAARGATALGMSNLAARNAAATFGVFGKSAKLSGAGLASFSTQMTTLAGDLASFHNKSPEEAITAIGAALRGETEPIRAFGVMMDDATMRSTALKMGLIKTTKEALTPQQKVLAAQRLIMLQTADAQGDFARTSDGLANQQRILAASVEDTKGKLGKLFLPIVTKIANYLNATVVPAVKAFIDGFSSGAGAGGAFRAVLEKVIGTLQAVGGFILGNLDAFKYLALGIAAVTAATAAHTLVLGISGGRLKAWFAQLVVVRTATAAWAAVTWILNGALAALTSPIGIVVLAIAALVAGFVWAYKNVEGFRNIVNAVWASVQAAFSAVVNWITGTAWPAITGVFSSIGDAAKAMWGVISPVLKFFWDFFKAIVVWLVKTAWNNIQTVFKAIGAVVSWLWNTVISPVFNLVWNLWKNVFGWFKNTGGPMVGNAMSAIGNVVKTVWENTVMKAFNAFKAGLGLLADKFGITKDSIGRVWDQLKNIAKAPIKFIIETVLNNGLIGGFNWLSSKIGGPQIPHIPLPAGFAKGGVMPGYTPGRDVHRFVSPTGGVLDLSGGEAVMRPEFTRAVGGKAGIARLNALSRKGQLPFQRMADGGVLGWIKEKGAGAFNWVAEKGVGIWKALTNPMEYLKGLIPGIPEGFKLVGEYVGAVKDKVLGLIVDKVKSLFGSFKGAYDTFSQQQMESGAIVPGGSAPKGVMGWRAQWAWLQARAPWAQLFSAYRPGSITATGNRSYHGRDGGRAIDVSPDKRIFNLIRSSFGAAIKELIFSPMNGMQVHNGKNHMYGGVTRGNHWDHVHWAMPGGGIFDPMLLDRGGILPPTRRNEFIPVQNRTGGPERLTRGGDWPASLTVNMTVSVDDLAKMSTLADFLEMLKRSRVDTLRRDSGMVMA